MKSRLPLVMLLWIWVSPWPRFGSSQVVDITSNWIKDNVGKALKSKMEEYLKFTSNDCSEGIEETRNHQVWLYTNYRGLWQYRLTRHHQVLDKPSKGEDVPDAPGKVGSVVFVNYQNTSLILDCPCGSDGQVEWKAHGKGSSVFNEAKQVSEVHFKTRAPPPRLYYRTYSCQVEKEIHYFNVFTRPLGLTTIPPLMFTEGISGPADGVNEVACELTMYQNLKSKPDRFNYIASPFQFYWQFPRPDTTVSPSRAYRQRPPEDSGKDNLFWDTGPGSLPAHPPDEKMFKFKAPKAMNPKGDICNLYNSTLESDLDPVTIRSTLQISGRATTAHRGMYACIVEDGNGLSSAYWWDGDFPPHHHFRGFTHIRVRAKKYIFMAVGIFVGLLLLVVLMILILPDNKEDFISDTPPPEPPPVESQPKEKKVTKSVKGSKTTTVSGAIEEVQLKPKKTKSAPSKGKLGK